MIGSQKETTGFGGASIKTWRCQSWSCVELVLQARESSGLGGGLPISTNTRKQMPWSKDRFLSGRDGHGPLAGCRHLFLFGGGGTPVRFFEGTMCFTFLLSFLVEGPKVPGRHFLVPPFSRQLKEGLLLLAPTMALNPYRSLFCCKFKQHLLGTMRMCIVW